MQQETVGAIIAALASAIIGTIVTVFFWLIKLGSRVTLLENGHLNTERAIELEQKALASGLRDIRSEIQAINAELRRTREEMLQWFTPTDDFKRLEDKVDSLRAAVGSPQQAGPAPRAKKKPVRRSV